MDDFEREYKLQVLMEIEDNLTLLQNHIDRGVVSDDLEMHREVFRLIHNVKGNARSADFDALAKIAHKLESILAEFGEALFSQDLDLLINFVDRCLEEITKTRPGLGEGMCFKPLYEQLERLHQQFAQENKIEGSRTRQTSYPESTKGVTDEKRKLNPEAFDESYSMAGTSLPKIVIIDDDSEILNVLQEALEEKLFAQVDISNDPLRILKKLMTESYHLIITDYHMNNLNGEQLISAIRKSDGPNQSAPIIFLSGYRPKLIPDAGLWDNFFFAMKPISSKKLHYYTKLALGVQFASRSLKKSLD